MRASVGARPHSNPILPVCTIWAFVYTLTAAISNTESAPIPTTVPTHTTKIPFVTKKILNVARTLSHPSSLNIPYLKHNDRWFKIVGFISNRDIYDVCSYFKNRSVYPTDNIRFSFKVYIPCAAVNYSQSLFA